MRRNLLVALVIVVLFSSLLYVFRKPAQRLWLRIRPAGGHHRVPSMIRSLPFKPQTRAERRQSLLVANLGEDQLYLPDFLLGAKGAPRGHYLQFSVVVQFASKKAAKRWREKRPLLENTIVKAGERFSYADLRTPDGREIFKRGLLKALRKELGAEITDLWLVEYSLVRVKGL